MSAISFGEALRRRVAAADSLLCIGLDPHKAHLPQPPTAAVRKTPILDTRNAMWCATTTLRPLLQSHHRNYKRHSSNHLTPLDALGGARLLHCYSAQHTQSCRLL